MRFTVTPGSAIWFTKLSVILICSWPPPLRATKNQTSLYNATWFTAFISAIGLLLPILSAICEYRNDPVILGKTVFIFAAVCQITTKMAICRLQQKIFQELLDEMENFVKFATTDEKAVLQRHVDRYKYIHFGYALWCFFAACYVIISPLYLQQTFPTLAKYPFPVEQQPVKSFIFFHQSLVAFQAAASLAIDAQVALLLRYTTARFEILGIQLYKANNECEVNAWIKNHNQLLRYRNEVYRAVTFLVLTTVTTSLIAVIFGSLNLVSNQPLALKVLYALLVFSTSVELFMYAWPADNLIHMSAETSLSAYNTNWFERNVKVQKKLLYIMLRSQQLEGIRINGVMPDLNLSYYSSFLYTAFSYFTAIRIMMDTTDNS